MPEGRVLNARRESTKYQKGGYSMPEGGYKARRESYKMPEGRIANARREDTKCQKGEY